MRLYLGRANMLMLLLAGPVCAQFAHLATTDDGSQLYFTSSMLLKGAKPGTWRESRLYRFGRDGLALFAERGPLAAEWAVGSDMGVTYPAVSGDGTVVGFTYSVVCLSAANCDKAVDRIEVRGSQTFDFGPGRVQISRSSRWALVHRETIASQPGSMFSTQTFTDTLIDLVDGKRTDVPDAVPSRWRNPTLTSDGGVLTTRPSGLTGIGGVDLPVYGVLKQGTFTPVPLQPDRDRYAVALTDDASTVIAYDLSSDELRYPKRLFAISVASGRITTIAEAKSPDRVPAFLSTANNGHRVLYAVGVEAFVWDAATGASTLIPLVPREIAVDGVLSGLGDVAFVATTHGRIVRFDLATKTVSSLFPATPQCDDPGPVAAGSFARLACTFDRTSADLEGQLTVTGASVPVIYSVPGEIGVQIPWQRGFFPTSELSIAVAGDAPFQASREIKVYDGAPQILPAESGLFGMKIVKGDWSGMLTTPPVPGDVFHVYMTGLGWTQNPEETGVRASLTKPNPIEWFLGCSWEPDSRPVELLYAGLAPGMLGIYQATFRTRAAPWSTEPITSFECLLQSPLMHAFFGPGIPVRGIYARGGFGSQPVFTPPPPPR